MSLNSIGYFAQILPRVQAGMLRRLRESVDGRLADQTVRLSAHSADADDARMDMTA